MELYDSIGIGYGERRRPDPRIATPIDGALADAESIVNVGAGAGSYEPCDRTVVAVEPSMVMIRQRPPEAAPAVRASATRLPLTMTLGRGLLVLFLTAAMCGLAALVALRKVRSADPAEVFG